MAGDNGESLSGWRCEECGKTSPRNDSPCGRCGSITYSPIYGTEHEPGEIEAGLASRIRRNRLIIGVGLLIGLGIAALIGAYLGFFVVGDPVTGMQFGAVGTSAPGDAPATGAEFHGAVRNDVQTDYLLWYGTTLRLEYRSGARSEDALALELGGIIRAYTDYIRAGGDAERLDIVASGPGDYHDTFYIKTEWAEATLSGELGTYAYIQRVVNTRNQ